MKRLTLSLMLSMAFVSCVLMPAMAAVNVTVNGTSHSIPEVGERGWGSNVTAWIQDISADVLYPTGGTFTLGADVDFGSSFGLEGPYFKSSSASIATSGVLRLANSDTIVWRNNADSGNVALGLSTDTLQWNGVNLVTISRTETLSNKTLRNADGSESFPSHSFQSDGDSGMYSKGSNILGLATNGADVLIVNTDSIELPEEVTTPSTPSSGGKIYTKSDNKLYFVNDGGTEYDLTSAAGQDTLTTITSADSPYTVTTNEHTILANADTAADITVNLYTCSSNSGKKLKIKKIDGNTTAAREIVIDGFSSELVDGQSDYRLNAEDEAVTIQCDGTNWHVISRSSDQDLGSSNNGSMSWVANATLADYHIKNGQILFYQFKVTLSGAPTSAALTYTFPNSWAADTGFYNSTSALPVGQCVVYDQNTGDEYAAMIRAGVTNTTVAVEYIDSNGKFQPVTDTAPITFASSDLIVCSGHTQPNTWEE